jgi:hypothetical protein
MKSISISAVILIRLFGILGFVYFAQAEEPLAGSGIPSIQFETNFFDFGSVTTGDTLFGTFKFKNVGTGVLKIDPPQASCECTEPKAKPDTVAPGESGEIVFTVKLDRALNGQRLINVHSNDPKTPSVRLIIQLDYSPMYVLNPKALRLVLPAGKQELMTGVTVTRADHKPPEVYRLTSSQEWVGATLDTPNELTNAQRINVTVRRPPGAPGPFEATVQLWSRDNAVQPLQTLRLAGEAFGEVAAIPARLYWVIPDFGKDKAAYPPESLMQKIELVSVLGHEVVIKNATSNIEGMKVQVVPRKAGQTFDLMLKFDELPQKFANGKVTVATSLASLPQLEVPISVAVPESN